MVKTLVVLSLVAAPFAAGVAQTPTASGDSLHAISLTEAVTLAQRNAPAAIQARGQLRTTASAVRAAYGAFIPSLTANVSQTQQAGQRFDNLRNQVVTATQPWNYSTGINSSLELFDGGRRFADLHARKADEDAAEANELAQRCNIALQVKTQYANAL